MRMVLNNLRWLPVRDRIRLKLCCLVHQAFHGTVPDYLRSLLAPAASSRVSLNLRSHHGPFLLQPVFARTLSRAAFCASGPRIWNDLPSRLRTERDIRRFKREVKKYFLSD